LYQGAGFVTFTEQAVASSGATGTGNLVVQISTSAAATVSVIYHYTPTNDLRPGLYTIVQTTEPPGFMDGFETSGNVVPIPGTIGTDSISVTLPAITSVSAENCFGEVKPSGLAGYVYVDANNDGVKQAGETPISGATVTLTGTNDVGPVSLTASTDA